jgi:hypothetical protein
MVSPDAQAIYCSELTRQENDPLHGTATSVKTWFLLEYQMPWRAKATADNELPTLVQEFLAAQLAAIPQSRLLFIKQQNEQPQDLRFFIIKTDEIAPAMLAFELTAYEDLLALDLAALAAEPEASGHFLRQEPLFLVCTNGTRDKCCAKFGLPIYDALRASQGDAVWQSSHIGGHRYAPNVLFLPHSVNYGLFTPDQAQAAAVAYRQGRLANLDHYRGRTYYPPHVQAADYFLRQAVQEHTLTDMRLLADQPLGEENWIVQFHLAADNKRHQLHIQRQMTLETRLVSCNTPAEKVVARYRLFEHTVESQKIG